MSCEFMNLIVAFAPLFSKSHNGNKCSALST